MRRMNVVNRKKALNVVKELDAFPKVSESYVETSPSSGGVSILVFGFIAVLVVSEIMYYSNTDLHIDYHVDTEVDGKLNINIDMTVAMRCNAVGADVLDITGEAARTFGRLEAEDVHYELAPNQQLYLNMLRSMNTYFSQEYHSLHHFLWLSGHKVVSTALPPRRDNLTTPTDACRFHGTLTVNKVAGNFHITAGKSIPVLPRGHAHLSFMLEEKDYNFTHRIDSFSFGTPAGGIINPLDGEMKHTATNYHLFQYFLQIVPTKVSISSYNVDTYQYAVTEKNRSLDHSSGSHGVPGIYMKYELSPLMVSVTQTYQPIWQLVVRLCGIVGGIFATSGLLHSLVGCCMDVLCCRFRFGRYSKLNERGTSPQHPTSTNQSGSTLPHHGIPPDDITGGNSLLLGNNALLDNSDMLDMESISLTDSSTENTPRQSTSSLGMLDASNSNIQLSNNHASNILLAGQ